MIEMPQISAPRCPALATLSRQELRFRPLKPVPGHATSSRTELSLASGNRVFPEGLSREHTLMSCAGFLSPAYEPPMSG